MGPTTHQNRGHKLSDPTWPSMGYSTVSGVVMHVACCFVGVPLPVRYHIAHPSIDVQGLIIEYLIFSNGLLRVCPSKNSYCEVMVRCAILDSGQSCHSASDFGNNKVRASHQAFRCFKYPDYPWLSGCCTLGALHGLHSPTRATSRTEYCVLPSRNCLLSVSCDSSTLLRVQLLRGSSTSPPPGDGAESSTDITTVIRASTSVPYHHSLQGQVRSVFEGKIILLYIVVD